MTHILQDLRYGVRMLVKHPWISLVAVVTLALGMGVNAVIFSSVYSVLLRPLPYRQPEKIVIAGSNDPANPSAGNEISFAEFSKWKERSHSFEALAAVIGWMPRFVKTGEARQLRGSLVTADYFPLFDARVVAGRTLTATDQETGGIPAVVIAESLWTEVFSREPGIVGRPLVLDEKTFTVVGVVDEGSVYPPNQQVWASLEAVAQAETLRNPARRTISAIGRLVSGTTAANAQGELRAIAAATASERAGNDAGLTVSVTPILEALIGKYRLGLLVLQWAVAFVLLIACTNLTNLLLAQTASRQNEFGIRLALGASRGRLILQLLSESFVLTLLGAAAGLIAAQATLQYLQSALSDRLGKNGPFGGITIDLPVAAFMALVAILTALVVGLTPALTASRPDLDRLLRAGCRGSGGAPKQRRIQGMLVVSEIALAMMLLVSAGLMIRTFNNVVSADPGFRTQNVLAVRLALPESRYADAARIQELVLRAEPRILALPGVESFAAMGYLPLIGYNPGMPFRLDGQDSTPTLFRADIQPMTPDYFKVLRIPLQRGQLFAAADVREAPEVAIVNSAFVRRFLPARDPLGAILRLGEKLETARPVRIVGVVSDIHQWGMLYAPRPEIYLPSTCCRRTMYFVAGTTVDPASVASAVRQQIEAVESNPIVYSVEPLSSILYYSVERRRILGLMLSTLGLLAMTMVSVAIYGVTAYSVVERWHELGVRVALGAPRTTVVRMVLGNAMRLALMGVGIGALGAAGIMRLIRSYLYGVSTIDPLTYLVVGGGIGLITLAASYFPARRATHADPIIALRCE
jgi:putative ABC transport system permease protein